MSHDENPLPIGRRSCLRNLVAAFLPLGFQRTDAARVEASHTQPGGKVLLRDAELRTEVQRLAIKCFVEVTCAAHVVGNAMRGLATKDWIYVYLDTHGRFPEGSLVR